MNVRAKFTVTKILGSGTEPRSISLSPVYDGSAENKSFFAATPGGSIELYCANPEATAQFTVGGEYYVDFTPAPK
jgi:hypothetical protein